jgi:hypothetical protein
VLFPYNWGKVSEVSRDLWTRGTYLELNLGNRFCRLGVALVVVLIIGLLGGLFHHHESDSARAACPLCSASVQTPVENLIGALLIRPVITVGMVSLDSPQSVDLLGSFDSTIPRAPPA